MVLQKLWVSQNFSQILRVSQSRFFFSSYVCLAVSFFYKKVSWSLDFSQGQGFQIHDLLVYFFKMTSSRQLILNLIKLGTH